MPSQSTVTSALLCAIGAYSRAEGFRDIRKQHQGLQIAWPISLFPESNSYYTGPDLRLFPQTID